MMVASRLSRNALHDSHPSKCSSSSAHTVFRYFWLPKPGMPALPGEVGARTETYGADFVSRDWRYANTEKHQGYVEWFRSSASARK